MYLLDTNVCVDALRRNNAALLDRIAREAADNLAVCSVVVAELHYGAMLSRRPFQGLALLNVFLAPFTSFAFDDSAAQIYGAVRAQLTLAGTPIGIADLQIAAIALARGCTLVTHNTRDFSRIPGLQLEDWHV